MSVAALALLALLDAGFAGFRAAAGRSPSVKKWSSGYYPRWIRRGLAAGALGLLAPVAAALVQVWMFDALTVDGLRARLDAFARPAAAVLAVYAAVVLLAFVPWTLARVELRTLISVTVFGPLTFSRAFVVVGAWVYALVERPDPVAALVVGAGCAAVLSLGPALGQRVERALRRDGAPL